MFDRISIKEKSKEQIRDKKGDLALASFFLFLIFIGISIFAWILGKIASPLRNVIYLITPPLNLGVVIYYITLAKTGERVDFGVNFQGFNNYLKSVGVNIMIFIFTFLWSLLLIIPGIIKGLSYSQSLYVLAENPNLGLMESIDISKKITKGYKMDIFVFYLSFIGWALLGSITFGIAYLWVFPYMSTSNANMYLRLKEIAIENGTCIAADLELIKILKWISG